MSKIYFIYAAKVKQPLPGFARSLILRGRGRSYVAAVCFGFAVCRRPL